MVAETLEVRSDGRKMKLNGNVRKAMAWYSKVGSLSRRRYEMVSRKMAISLYKVDATFSIKYN